MTEKPRAHYRGHVFTDDDVVNLDAFIPDGEYNPHNVRPFLIYSALGTRAVAFADSLQDALDAAADNDKLDADRISPEDFDRLSPEEQNDGSFLGNTGEPYNLTDINATELPIRPHLLWPCSTPGRANRPTIAAARNVAAC